MNSCAVVSSPMVMKKFSTKNQSPLVPRTLGNSMLPAAIASIQTEVPYTDCQDKENRGLSENKSWLSKVCSKLRSKHRRLEKCEKCGQRSDTCRANPSFISSRKHYLCQDCRVSSHNMKNMYHQLCRNLSLREPTRTFCNSGEVSPPVSARDAFSRSKSMRVTRQNPESGYETATSLDSSCSNGRLSPDPVSTSSGECGHFTTDPADGLDCSPACSQTAEQRVVTNLTMCSKDNHVCSKDKAEVFSSAFKSQRVHLQQLQRHNPQFAGHQHLAPPKPHVNHPRHHQHHADLTDDSERYDGYLEVRKPKSHTVKYVFTQNQPEGQQHQQQQQQKPKKQKQKKTEKDVSHKGQSENLKQCYHCQKYHCVAFRAPFSKGWLCEDCMDDMM